MFLVKLISRLPFWLLYWISDFLYVVSYHLVRYRRKLVMKNLKNAFANKSTEELARIEREFYRNLCDYAVETLKLVSLSKEELSKRMVYKEAPGVQRYKEQKQSIIFLASHQFNWEWLLAAGTFNLSLNIDFVYQPLNNDFFDKFSLLSRTQFGAYPIKRAEVARETLRRKDILRGVAIVADQYPGLKADKKFETTFLHQDTVFFQGSNQLAILTQYPVFFGNIRKVKRGYYEVELEEIASPPYAKDSTLAIEQYIRAVEALIEKHPSGWLWSHNRWKKRHLKKTEAPQS